MMLTFHSSTRRVFACLSGLALVALTFGSGCGSVDEQRLPVFPVSGEVSVRGKPAVNALVVFHPLTELSGGLRPTGLTGLDGKFSLSTYESGDGAPAGEYRVTIVLPEAPSGPNPDPDLAADLLKGRYANPATSKLHARVQEGTNQLSAFALQ